MAPSKCNDYEAYMCKNRILTMLLLSAFLPCCFAFERLDKESVESFVDSVDRAFMRQDIASIERFVSDSLSVEVAINDKSYSYDKNTYLALLKETWKAADGYSYQKVNSEINLVNSTKAIVNEKVIETTVMGREVYSVASDLVVEVQLINGALLATRLTAKSKLDTYTNDVPTNP